MLTTSMDRYDEPGAKAIAEIKKFKFKPFDKVMLRRLLNTHFAEMM